jgi:hypothetical protein
MRILPRQRSESPYEACHLPHRTTFHCICSGVFRCASTATTWYPYRGVSVLFCINKTSLLLKMSYHAFNNMSNLPSRDILGYTNAKPATIAGYGPC